MSQGAAPLPVRLYQSAANLAAPLAYRRVFAKLHAQGIGPERIRERRGVATAKRPEGKLLWFHAASVGESLSVLRLITHLGSANPEWSFLLTSGTATSAQVVSGRLPPRTTHQFAPLDARGMVKRFLSHWRPDAAVLVESELWPQMIAETHAAGIPLALINARISDRSAGQWKRFPRSAAYLLRHFRLIHCQDQRTVGHLHDLGLTQARSGANLKALSGALPFDSEELERMRACIAARPVWLASSTHPGEDEIMLAAHLSLISEKPEALLVLVPRHPERADAVERLIAEAGLAGIRRSTGRQITDRTQVYLADTLGETGLWYALSPLTCLCGSFVPVGGHNPYEPAFAGSAILHGPLYANFSQIYPALDEAGGACEVSDAEALAAELCRLNDDAAALKGMRRDVRRFASEQEDVLESFGETLSKVLGLS